eukprot:6456653-Amphidinium_carterae.1
MSWEKDMEWVGALPTGRRCQNRPLSTMEERIRSGGKTLEAKTDDAELLLGSLTEVQGAAHGDYFALEGRKRSKLLWNLT